MSQTNTVVLSTLIVVCTLLVPGCGSKKTEAEQTAANPNQAQAGAPEESTVEPTTSEPTRSRAQSPALEPSEIKWTRYKSEAAKVSFDSISLSQVRERTMSGSSYARQVAGPIQIAMWFGSTRTIDGWRSGFSGRSDAKLGQPKKVKVCGVEGEVQEAITETRRMTTRLGASPQIVARAKDGTDDVSASGDTEELASNSEPVVRTLPGRTIVVLAFKHAGTPIIASWGILNDQRETFRAAEERFLASFQCH